MKRSTIDHAIDEALSVCDKHGFKLPPWATWTASQWKDIGSEADEIRDHGLGWNMTDFGSGDFSKQGLLLFVIRNGLLGKNGKPSTTKTYAEKAFVVGPGQVTPWHFHWVKTEDLVNRGGGRLLVEVAWATQDEKSLSPLPVEVVVDGITREVNSADPITLEPGQSIEFPPRLWHKFYGKSGDPTVVAGEVSSLNNDATDNCFLTDATRSPIEEDAPAKYILLNEYFTAPTCC